MCMFSMYPESVGESQTKTSPHKEFPNIYCLLYIHVCLAHYLLFGHSYHLEIYFMFFNLRGKFSIGDA